VFQISSYILDQTCLSITKYEAKKKNKPIAQAMPELVLPQTQLSPELVLPQTPLSPGLVLPQAEVLTELVLPHAEVMGELVLEPINKALREENAKLKTENEVLKEREASKNKEMLLKQELVDEYKARASNVEVENQKFKDEIQRVKDENERLKEQILSLKEREITLRVENEFPHRRDQEDRAMLHTMMPSMMNGMEDRKRKRNNEDEETM
jgi:hypothetical protein